MVLRKETETVPAAFNFPRSLFSAHLWAYHIALSAFLGAPSKSACSLNKPPSLPHQDFCTRCLSLWNILPYQAPRHPSSLLHFNTPFSWLSLRSQVKCLRKPSWMPESYQYPFLARIFFSVLSLYWLFCDWFLFLLPIGSFLESMDHAC